MHQTASSEDRFERRRLGRYRNIGEQDSSSRGKTLRDFVKARQRNDRVTQASEPIYDDVFQIDSNPTRCALAADG